MLNNKITFQINNLKIDNYIQMESIINVFIIYLVKFWVKHIYILPIKYGWKVKINLKIDIIMNVNNEEISYNIFNNTLYSKNIIYAFDKGERNLIKLFENRWNGFLYENDIDRVWNKIIFTYDIILNS